MKQIKTAAEWFKDLPQPFQNQAIQAKSCDLEAKFNSLAEAIIYGFSWRRTKQGDCYWCAIYKELGGKVDVSGNNPENPRYIEALKLFRETSKLSAESTLPEAPTPNPTPMHKYSDQPVATPTLVFGTDVTDLNAQACISTITANNGKIEELTKTGIKSPYIDQQIAGLNAANAALVKRLDSFAAPAAPEA